MRRRTASLCLLAALLTISAYHAHSARVTARIDAADSFSHSERRGAKPTPDKFKMKPVFLVPAEAFGLSPEQNLDPFKKEGKLTSQDEWAEAIKKMWEHTFGGKPKQPFTPGTYLGFIEQQSAGRDAAAFIETEGPSRATRDSSRKDGPIPTYYLGPSEGISAYNNADPFNPGAIDVSVKRQLLERRWREMAANPLYQATPMLLPPPNAVLT